MRINGELQNLCNEAGVLIKAYQAKDKSYYFDFKIPTLSNYCWENSIKLPDTSPDVKLDYIVEKIMNVWSSFDIEAEVEKHKIDIGKEDGCENLDQLINNMRYVENKLDEMMEKVSSLFEKNQKAIYLGHNKPKRFVRVD